MTDTTKDPVSVLREALRKAFNFGQTYWQQADSDYVSQNKKSDETASKFAAFVDVTCATLAAIQHSEQRETVPAGEVVWSYECAQPGTDGNVWCEFYSRTAPAEANGVRNIRSWIAHPVSAPTGETWQQKMVGFLPEYDGNAAPVPEAKAEQVGDFDAIVNLLTDQKEDVKKRDGDWWRGYEAALHWIAKAINEKKSEANHAN